MTESCNGYPIKPKVRVAIGKEKEKRKREALQKPF